MRTAVLFTVEREQNYSVLDLLFATSVAYLLFDRGLHAMKICLFCQLATRHTFARSTRDFQRRVPRISSFLMIFVILEHRYTFVATLRQKRSHFPLNHVHLLHKIAEKVTPDVSALMKVSIVTKVDQIPHIV